MSKNLKKLTKCAKIDERNLHIFWTTWWILIKIWGKTCDNIISHQKSGLDSLNLLPCEHRNPLLKFNNVLMNIRRIPIAELKSHQIRNYSNVIFSYLNINSIRNKFDNLKLIIYEHVGILCVTETKTDKSFPTTQFSSKSYALSF